MTDAQLYVPRFNVMDADDVRPFVEAVATAQLVTVGDDGVPDATFLPVLWEGDRLVGHLARANAHWRRIVDGSPALAIVTGPDTYVSPSWYATKAEHGKVVPTWNYSVVHLRGRIVGPRRPRVGARASSPASPTATRATARRAVGRHRRPGRTTSPRTSARSSASSSSSRASRPRPSSARTAPTRTARASRAGWPRTARTPTAWCSSEAGPGPRALHRPDRRRRQHQRRPHRRRPLGRLARGARSPT